MKKFNKNLENLLIALENDENALENRRCLKNPEKIMINSRKIIEVHFELRNTIFRFCFKEASIFFMSRPLAA